MIEFSFLYSAVEDAAPGSRRAQEVTRKDNLQREPTSSVVSLLP
jgi:hypothetical protein